MPVKSLWLIWASICRKQRRAVSLLLQGFSVLFCHCKRRYWCRNRFTTKHVWRSWPNGDHHKNMLWQTIPDFYIELLSPHITETAYCNPWMKMNIEGGQQPHDPGPLSFSSSCELVMVLFEQRKHDTGVEQQRTVVDTQQNSRLVQT